MFNIRRKTTLFVCVWSVFFWAESALFAADMKVEKTQTKNIDSLSLSAGGDDKSSVDRRVMLVVENLMTVGRYQRAAFVLKKEHDCFTNQAIFLPYLINLYASRDYRALIQACDQWLKANSTRPSKFDSVVYEFIGTIYTEGEWYEKAREAFDKAAAIDPRDRIAKSREECDIGCNRAQTGSDASSSSIRRSAGLESDLNMLIAQQCIIPAVETMLQSDSNASKISVSTRDYVTRAEEFESLGEFRKAKTLYARASKNSDFDASMWNEYALCFFTVIGTEAQAKDDKKLEQYRNSRTQLSKRLAIQTTRPIDWQNALKKAGRHEKPSSQARSEIIDYFPAENHELRKVQEFLDRAISLDKDDWRIWSNLGLVRYSLGENDLAMEALDKALSFKEITAGQRYAIGKRKSFIRKRDLLKQRFRDRVEG